MKFCMIKENSEYTVYVSKKWKCTNYLKEYITKYLQERKKPHDPSHSLGLLWQVRPNPDWLLENMFSLSVYFYQRMSRTSFLLLILIYLFNIMVNGVFFGGFFKNTFYLYTIYFFISTIMICKQWDVWVSWIT